MTAATVRRPRTLWHDVLDARHAHHQHEGQASRETWRPDETERWLAELIASLDIVADAVTGPPGPNVIDPRAALVELMAAAAAWADAMDGRP